MAPCWDPFWLQNQSKIVPQIDQKIGGSNMAAQDRPERHQDHPKSSQDHPKTVPRAPSGETPPPSRALMSPTGRCKPTSRARARDFYYKTAAKLNISRCQKRMQGNGGRSLQGRRWGKGRSEQPQETPKHPKEASRSPQEASKNLPRVILSQLSQLCSTIITCSQNI